MRPAALRALGPPCRVLLWHLLVGTSRLLSPQAVGRSCLVVAPHPDDDVLGCGAIIATKVAAGTPLDVLIVSDGASSSTLGTCTPATLAATRRRECADALAVLGVPPDRVRFLDLPDGQVEDHAADLLAALSETITQLQPEQVLSTSPHDPHRDHAAVGRAVRNCLRGSRIELLEYPVWQWRHPLAMLRSLSAGRRLKVDARPQSAVKHRAIRTHRSQIIALEPGAWTLDPRFLINFQRSFELFVRVRPAGPPQ